MTAQPNTLKRWQWLFLALIVVFCAWFMVTFSPKRQPETPEQFAQAVKDCFSSGHENYSVKEGCW